MDRAEVFMSNSTQKLAISETFFRARNVTRYWRN